MSASRVPLLPSPGTPGEGQGEGPVWPHLNRSVLGCLMAKPMTVEELRAGFTVTPGEMRLLFGIGIDTRPRLAGVPHLKRIHGLREEPRLPRHAINTITMFTRQKVHSPESSFALGGIVQKLVGYHIGRAANPEPRQDGVQDSTRK